MKKKLLESSVTTVESGSRKELNHKKPMSTSERIDALPKVNLKRISPNKPSSVQDLELRADNIILE
jgi:hypothetical protein